MYKLSKKSVVISHKKSNTEKIKSILPAFILTLAGTFAIWVYEKTNSLSQRATPSANDAVYSLEKAGSEAIQSAPESIFNLTLAPLWTLFLAGALIAIFIISIINWRKL